SAQPAPPLPSSPGAASLLPGEELWVVNFNAIPEHSAPIEDSDTVATLRKFTYLAIKDWVGDWIEVLNPPTRVTGFVPNDAVDPAEPPPDYIRADPPPAVDEINMDGRAFRGATLSFYPAPDADAQTETLSLNTPVTIADSVEGDDGEMWYRTSEGDYLPS